MESSKPDSTSPNPTSLKPLIPEPCSIPGAFGFQMQHLGLWLSGVCSKDFWRESVNSGPEFLDSHLRAQGS